MLNHIVVAGRLTRNPELRSTGNGIPVASFTLAVERDYKAKDGGKETDFIDVTAWRNTAEFVSKFFTKGRMAIVSGSLQMRKWTDKNGNNRVSAEIVADNVYFGDSKRDAEPYSETEPNESTGIEGFSELPIDDDIPFWFEVKTD